MGTAAITGTVTESVNEAAIVTGAKTLVITLTDDTWIGEGAGSPEIIGYDSIGASSTAALNTDIRASAMDAPTQSGNITKIEIYSSSSSVSLKVGVYQDSSGVPGSIVGSEVEFAGAGTWTAEWHEFSGLSIPVTSGTNYWLCVHVGAGSLTAYYDVLTGTKNVRDTHTYATAWPATYTNNGSSAAQFSIRATVTP